MDTIINIMICCAIPVVAVDIYFIAILIGITIEDAKERWRK